MQPRTIARGTAHSEKYFGKFCIIRETFTAQAGLFYCRQHQLQPFGKSLAAIVKRGARGARWESEQTQSRKQKRNMRMKQRKLNQYESLENRICLTVSAAVTDAGNLLVSGDADGPVEIRALGDGAFSVTDGDSVEEVTGVTGGIHLRITDAEPVDDGGGDGGGDGGDGTPVEPTATLTDEIPPADPANEDSVVIDLGGESVERIFASLGSGDNSLVIQNGSVLQSLAYRGGPHDDSLVLAEGATVGGHMGARMGHGDNGVRVAGDVDGSVHVRSGSGDDSVQIGTEATVGRRVSARLGSGDNTLVHSGDIGGSLRVAAGDGDDTVGVREGATVGRSLVARLGAGNNDLGIAGTVDAFFRYYGRDGEDTVRVGETGSVGRSAFVRLGTGDNTLGISGSIGRHLLVGSGNAEGEDTIEIAEDAVGGRTLIHYGGGQGDGGDNTNVRSTIRARLRR